MTTKEMTDAEAYDSPNRTIVASDGETIGAVGQIYSDDRTRGRSGQQWQAPHLKARASCRWPAPPRTGTTFARG